MSIKKMNKKADTSLFVGEIIVRLILSIVLIFALGACVYKYFSSGDEDFQSFRELNEKIANIPEGDITPDVDWNMKGDTFVAYFSADAPAVFAYEAGANIAKTFVQAGALFFSVGAAAPFVNPNEAPILREYIGDSYVRHMFMRPNDCPNGQACGCICRAGAQSLDDPGFPGNYVWSLFNLGTSNVEEYTLTCPYNQLVCEPLGKKNFPLIHPFAFFPADADQAFINGYWVNGYLFFRNNHFEGRKSNTLKIQNYKETVFLCKDIHDGACTWDRAIERVDKQEQQDLSKSFENFFKSYESCIEDSACQSLELDLPKNHRILHQAGGEIGANLATSVLGETKWLGSYILNLYEDYTFFVESPQYKDGKLLVEYYEESQNPILDDYLIGEIKPELRSGTYAFTIRPWKSGDYKVKVTHQRGGRPTSEKIIPITVQDQGELVYQKNIGMNFGPEKMIEYIDRDFFNKNTIPTSSPIEFDYNNKYEIHILTNAGEDVIRTRFPKVQVFFQALSTVQILSDWQSLSTTQDHIEIPLEVTPKGDVHLYLVTEDESRKTIEQSHLYIRSEGVKNFPKTQIRGTLAGRKDNAVLQYLDRYNWKTVNGTASYFIQRCRQGQDEIDTDAIYREGKTYFLVRKQGPGTPCVQQIPEPPLANK